MDILNIGIMYKAGPSVSDFWGDTYKILKVWVTFT